MKKSQRRKANMQYCKRRVNRRKLRRAASLALAWLAGNTPDLARFKTSVFRSL